jgi:hypothetical protein
MTEPPTYTVATDFEEIEQLREVIDALRANNGRLLRLLIKRLSNAVTLCDVCGFFPLQRQGCSASAE